MTNDDKTTNKESEQTSNDEDFLSKFLKGLTELKIGLPPKGPFQVSKLIIDNWQDSSFNYRTPPLIVAVRPCAEEYQNKTYLGVYLGDFPRSVIPSYNSETNELAINFHTNPCIYVFDIDKIVWGMESWWNVIKSPEQLRQITDLDINNVWYVQVLKSLEKKQN